MRQKILLNGATGAIRNGINTVENAGKNTMNDIKNGTQDAMNNIQNTTQNIMDNDQNSGNISPSDSDYTVQRTAGEMNNDFFGFMNNNNIWAWIVIGIVALAVVGIIWYYMTRKNDYSNHE